MAGGECDVQIFFLQRGRVWHVSTLMGKGRYREKMVVERQRGKLLERAFALKKKKGRCHTPQRSRWLYREAGTIRSIMKECQDVC